MTINQQFDEKRILPYIMVGDGGIQTSTLLLDLYVKMGCKVIEIGVPFSDPAADGKTIQQSAKRALKHHITLKDCLTFIENSKLKYPNISFILMTYLNPIIDYGIEAFFSNGRFDGIIVPDMPIEEYDILYPDALKNNKAIIPLITLNTNIDRMKTILSKSGGFVYVVTLKGVTGTKQANAQDSTSIVKTLRQLTNLPIVAGFGIKTKKQVKEFHESYNGVIIASQLITLANDNNFKEIKELLK